MFPLKENTPGFFLYQIICQDQYVAVTQLVLETDLSEFHRVLTTTEKKNTATSNISSMFHLHCSVGKIL